MNGLKNEWGKVVWYESSALRETVTHQTSLNPLRMLNLRHRDTDPGECGSRNIDNPQKEKAFAGLYCKEVICLQGLSSSLYSLSKWFMIEKQASD